MGLIAVVPSGMVSSANMQAAPSWVPTDMASLTAWWDFSDTATISHTAGAVNSVTDKSGNTHTLSATTTARPTTGTRTLNSLNVLDYNGTTNILTTASFTQAYPYTLGIVLACDNGANSTREQLFSGVTVGYGLEKSTTNAWRLSGGGSLDSTVTVDATPTVIVAMNFSTNSTINVDGTETTGSPGTGAFTGGVNVGSRSTGFMNGYIGEVLLYNGNKGTDDRGTIRTYLTEKWNL